MVFYSINQSITPIDLFPQLVRSELAKINEGKTSLRPQEKEGILRQYVGMGWVRINVSHLYEPSLIPQSTIERFLRFHFQKPLSLSQILQGTGYNYPWDDPSGIISAAQTILDELVRRGTVSLFEGALYQISDTEQAESVRSMNPSVLKKAYAEEDYADNAALAQERPDRLGGIDLNPALLDLEIKRDSRGVPLPLEKQPVADMHIEGFVPVIIQIKPVTNLPLLLGIAEDDMKLVLR